MSLLNHYVVALLTTSCALFILGLFVYFKGRHKTVNITFTFYSLCIAIWSLGQAYHNSAADRITAIFWARYFHAGVIFISTVFVHFTLTLLGIDALKRKLIRTLYITSFVFLLFDFTPLFIPDAVPKFSLNYYWTIGPVYIPFLIFWSGSVIYALYKLYKAYHSEVGMRRNQLQYLYWSTLFGYLGGSSNYLPAFNIHLYPFNPFGTYTVPIYGVIIAYAIIKYRLMDINIAIGKLATYLFLLAIISAVYLGLMWGIGRVFPNLPAYNPFAYHFLIFFLLSIALIYFIPRMKGETGEGIEKFFFKNKFKYREAFREFSKRLALIPGEEKLLTESVDNIAQAMEASKVAIMLMDDLSGNYIIRASCGLDGKVKDSVFTAEDGIIKWLRDNKKVFLLEEVDKILSHEKFKQIKIELKDREGVVYFPLIIHNELGGILVLGEKASRGMYSHIDIELLEDFASQLALSISYKRLESQMMRADRLVSLGTLAAGMAHEIRNPLSSIQIFAQLLPEKYDDKEFREEFSKIVASDTQRINRIIESVMALANPRPSVSVLCNPNELLNETLFFIESNIKKNGIKVIRSYDEQLPQIKADSEQLRQVFLNILLNALSVIPKDNGQLTISTRQKLINSIPSGKKDKYVQIEIKDNGTGIEKKLLERIFEPFFTTRPDGTGLGLAIVHRIIEQHRGFVQVDSEVGKGATFLINLPLEAKQ